MKKEPIQDLAHKIGEELAAARRALGITQEQASERIGITVEYYARIERGQSRPSLPVFSRIAVAMNVSADVLLGLAETMEQPNRAPPAWFEPPKEEENRQLQRVMRRLRQIPPEFVTVVDGLVRQLERFLEQQRKKGPPS